MKSSRPYPDLILYNGKIRTFTSENSTCHALACSGGRIVATGDADAVRRFAGPDTQTIDLNGRTVVPGLTDTHVHLSEKGRGKVIAYVRRLWGYDVDLVGIDKFTGEKLYESSTSDPAAAA